MTPEDLQAKIPEDLIEFQQTMADTTKAAQDLFKKHSAGPYGWKLQNALARLSEATHWSEMACATAAAIAMREAAENS